jgi:hypothetical protein
MEQRGNGIISTNDLMQRLVQAKKVMQKVETGDFERGSVNEDILRSDPEELIKNQLPQQTWSQNPNPPVPNLQKIQESKLPDAIKKAMIENPIPQISLSDSLDLNFVEKTKKLMESQGIPTKTNKTQSTQTSNPDLIKQLTPIIENVVRKTVTEILDSKLNQILTAQQTLSINESLVLKVGDSIFKGKITGVNKSK